VAAARVLIVDGLAERWGALDPARNPDLQDPLASYRDGLFLVAELHGAVVGTGALRPEQPGVMRIVRMSVAKQLRGRGIGSSLLRALIASAGTEGAHTVVLETTEAWQDAVDFYHGKGFVDTHRQEGDLHMALSLLPATS
jgi:GNAT superfamily N-acetyltransferase